MRILLLAVLSLVAVPALEAQMNLDQSEPRNPNMPITYQAVSLFRPDSAMYRVDIHYRIGQSFFIFVRNESSVSKVERGGGVSLSTPVSNP